jgi:hypothetical protein
VWATAAPHTLDEVRSWAPELVVAQQWGTTEASGWAAALKRPFVMLVHGPGQYEHAMAQCDLVVFGDSDLRDLAAPALGRTPAIVHALHDAAGYEALRERLLDVGRRGRRRPTLTLCMTVCNEAATLAHAIASVAPRCDEVVIGVDARSRDATAQIAREAATRTFAYEESSPPDFPRMRNRAMALVETDWAIVLDGHEWIDGADRIAGALETAAWSIEIETLFEPDERRIPSLAFPFPRIHRRHVRFTGAPAHEEVTSPAGRRDTRLDIKVWHERKPGDAARARQQEKSGGELACLAAAWQERGDRRALFYLANGLREAGRMDEAIARYEEYLRAPNFEDEGWQARLYLARCHAAKRDWPRASAAFGDAILAAPERAEAVVGLGHVLREMAQPRAAAAWFRMATALPRPERCRMFVEVPTYEWGAWHGLALALGEAGDFGAAADAEARALERGAGPWAADNVVWWRARARDVS